MSIPKYAAKRDKSEPGIVKVLRQCGFSVELTDRPTDALLGFRGVMWAAEFKTGRKGYGKSLNANQQAFADGWRGPPVVVLHDEQEALEWAMSISSQSNKPAAQLAKGNA